LNDNPFINALINSFGKYFSATVFSAIVGMLMNKYYTNIFSVEDYGVLSLYLTFILYLQTYIAFSLDSSWSRLYFEYRNQKKEFFSTIINFSICSIIFWIIILFIFESYIQKILGGSNTMYWGAICVVIVGVLVKIFNILATLENQASLVRAQTVLQTVCNNVFAILMIFFNAGILSRIIGNFLGYMANAVCYLHALKKCMLFEYGIIFNKKIFVNICPFFLSLFFNTAVISTLSYFDRILLNSYHGAYTVGIFSLGVLIGQGISMISEACAKALFPTIINSLDENYGTGIKQLKKLDNMFLMVYFFMFVGIYCLRDILVIVFANESYLAASRVIPLVVLGYITGALYKNVSGVLLYHKFMWYISVSGIVAYCISAFVNYILIPVDAEKGAAFALLLGNLLYSLFLHIRVRKFYFNLAYVLCRHIFILSVGIILYVVV